MDFETAAERSNPNADNTFVNTDRTTASQENTVKPPAKQQAPVQKKESRFPQSGKLKADKSAKKQKASKVAEEVENVRVAPKAQPKPQATTQKRPTSLEEALVNKISILEPRTYTESKEIAKCIFRNEIVIVNFHLVDENQARRIVDFLTGTVYALDGDIQRLGGELFICTPPNTEVDSATAKSLLQTQFNGR
ncbi:cell division protein SepF [Vagococcus coleopterorum]|uniref:Cell division protein SepF n=2 Tax=Vagococcus coleopterorum TaxID=2714946 RepID=A0A6G8APM1_9ENTE|nr:cell division protein SepF [Vagococcus coleopterorum]